MVRSPSAHSRSSERDETPSSASTPVKKSQARKEQTKNDGDIPPLPDEPIPPLPSEAPPDDGWEPVWDPSASAYYFFNRVTQVSQWENPRVPEPATSGLGNHDRIDKGPPGTSKEKEKEKPASRPHGGYDPAIHGDYDPTASYARGAQEDAIDPEANEQRIAEQAAIYAQSGAFNRWTGKWQSDDVNPENHNDENKSKRQMNAFFDVDAAANSHNGRSLKAERSGKKLSKQELKAFKEKRKERKEEKRRAWLRD